MTACAASRNAAKQVAAGATAAVVAGAGGCPRVNRHAATSAISATAVSKLVRRCAPSPTDVPVTSSNVNSATIAVAMCGPRDNGCPNTAEIDAPSTTPIAAVDAHVEIHSIRPTTNAA